MEGDNKTKAITLAKELLDRPEGDWEFVTKVETNGNTMNCWKKLGLEGEAYTTF